MNKQQQIKSLTWKYFWRQKLDEISYFLNIVWSFGYWIFIIGIISTFVPYGLGVLLKQNFIRYFTLVCESNNTYNCLNTIYGTWEVGITFMLQIFVLCTLLYIITLPVHYWIKQNWKRASSRARSEIK